jgi:hypothetical protein
MYNSDARLTEFPWEVGVTKRVLTSVGRSGGVCRPTEIWGGIILNNVRFCSISNVNFSEKERFATM